MYATAGFLDKGLSAWFGVILLFYLNYCSLALASTFELSDCWLDRVKYLESIDLSVLAYTVYLYVIGDLLFDLPGIDPWGI